MTVQQTMDWFQGGALTLMYAANADDDDTADAILRTFYRGPDVDGVECRWEIK